MEDGFVPGTKWTGRLYDHEYKKATKTKLIKELERRDEENKGMIDLDTFLELQKTWTDEAIKLKAEIKKLKKKKKKKIQIIKPTPPISDDDEEFNEWCEKCNKKMSDKKLTEEEYDEYPDRDIGYDYSTGESVWLCRSCRPMPKVLPPKQIEHPADVAITKQIEAELENLPQYEVCCGECETKLTINTPIMCYTSPDSEDWEHYDETLCNDCYWECGYWKDDANPNNKEEVEEKIESLMKKLRKVMTKADKEELRAIITKRT